MAHSTPALTKAVPEARITAQPQGSFFTRSEGGSFRQSLQNAAAQATGQTQKTAPTELSKKDAEKLYEQFFAVQMFRLLPLTTPDRYEED